LARKKKQAAHENHERWLVSYADFITLLFAFFVVMFASSQTDKSKAQQVSDSVKTALEQGGVQAAVHEILGGTVDEKGKGNAQMKGPGGSEPKNVKTVTAPAELLPSLTFLTTALKAEIQAGKLELHMEPRGLVISLRQGTFFPSGEDSLDPATFESLDKIAKMIHELHNPVRLEGHTDSIPIHTARFRSNWELSAARSIVMLELLTTKWGIPRERLAIAGYADTMPKESNDTAEGRAHNRRVDVVILNQQVGVDAVTSPEPVAAGQKPTPGATPQKSAPAAPTKK
jgi:chemotaxis protein MotB